MSIRVLRVYHGGRDPQHRARESALQAAGVEVTLAVPSQWGETGHESELSPEPFPIIELPVKRPGDVNRHAYVTKGALRRVLADAQPEVLDIHEEPFSLAARQWLRAATAELPVLMYSAQNVDKRFPPPFSRLEAAALGRATACYPCSRQAASVLRGKGFSGRIEVLPLGYDDTVFRLGHQSLDADEIVLVLVGRLVPEKGVADAVRTLAHVHAMRPARLMLIGSGSETEPAAALASSLGVGDRVELAPWRSGEELAADYQKAHVVLVPSRPTETWVEQFGRVIVEAQASGAVVAGYSSGAIPEVAGEAGIVVATGDVERLSEAVARVVADPDEFASRREAGRVQSTTRTWHAVASRQAALYEAVHAGQNERLRLSSSPRRRRAEARAEFGPTASTISGERPFAMPVLRRGGQVASALAATIDAANEIAARLR
jgi:glycosyltransferase involved in cell wall biosynthesis